MLPWSFSPIYLCELLTLAPFGSKFQVLMNLNVSTSTTAFIFGVGTMQDHYKVIVFFSKV